MFNIIDLKSFEESGISKDLVKALNELNITTPTKIQREVIPFKNLQTGFVVYKLLIF